MPARPHISAGSPAPSNRPAFPTAYIGISGYVYPHWRGAFYPKGLAQRLWLGYAGERFNSIELNGTFYSLKSPALFEKWVFEIPREGFVFAVKGSRFITHILRLKNTEQALANFFASGLLALGPLTGPLLWQLPPSDQFDPQRLEAFIESLPTTGEQAAQLAERHDERLKRGALVVPSSPVIFRHAFEVRHESYNVPEFYDILRKHDCAFVLADTAGKFLYADRVTTDFVYVRLHGSQELYVSRYSDEELEEWATRIKTWLEQGKSVYAYFDNDARGHAPYDALRLAALVEGSTEIAEEHPGQDFRGRV